MIFRQGSSKVGYGPSEDVCLRLCSVVQLHAKVSDKLKGVGVAMQSEG